jgi:hypothetical protein
MNLVQNRTTEFDGTPNQLIFQKENKSIFCHVSDLTETSIADLNANNLI